MGNKRQEDDRKEEVEEMNREIRRKSYHFCYSFWVS
jgi:hypothetical protein